MRTYVICTGGRVIGCYALTVGAIAQTEATSRTWRNTPDPIPAMVIGRLAIDSSYHGRGLGRAFPTDAVLRAMQAADIAGIRAILVHAVSEDAKRFYHRRGFKEPPLDPMTLMITVRDDQQALAGKTGD